MDDKMKEKLNLIQIGSENEKSLCITEEEVNRALLVYQEGKELCYENGNESIVIKQDGTMYIDGVDYIFNIFCPAFKDGDTYKRDRSATYQNAIKALVKKVIISDKTTSLAAAFQNFKKLKEVVLPSTVTYLYNPFMNCPKLKPYTLPTSLKTIGGQLYGIYPEKIELPSGLETIHESTFEEAPIKSIKIPSLVKKLPYATFRNCAELEQVIFEEGIEAINTKAFAKCSKLNNVVFPKSLKEIDSDSFYSCKSLENVTFLGNTKIDRDSFDDSPCQKDMYPRIFDSIDTIEYQGDTSKIADYEKIVSTQQGKTLYEQAKSFYVLVNDYETKSSYSDIDSERTVSGEKLLADFRETEALVLKNGIIVGIEVKGKLVLAGECICTYFAIDEDGTGRDEVEEYTTLIFKLLSSK